MEDSGAAKSKVFLGLPYYSPAGGTTGNTLAVAEAVASQISVENRLMLATVNSSDLPMCFNSLWCQALNNRPYDWFVMLHSDIRPVVKENPKLNWLDYLIAGAEAMELDCLSCVVAIKDDTGDTSTAIEKKGEWPPLKRLKFADFDSLLMTNEQEPDLLINTGCMAIRFGKPWVEKFAFTFDSWIEQVPDGRYMPRSLTEDWAMSMFMRDNGLKFGATTAIGCEHLGNHVYRW